MRPRYRHAAGTSRPHGGCGGRARRRLAMTHSPRVQLNRGTKQADQCEWRVPRAAQRVVFADREGPTQMPALPNIVLVHGAWADGSSWSDVIEPLQADGYTVTAPQFPLTALADDVARL